MSARQLVPQSTRPPNITYYNKNNRGIHSVIDEPYDTSFCSYGELAYNPILCILSAMYIAFGIVYVLFGYRCFKATMFLTGFTCASLIVYLICLQEYLMPQYGNVCVALCAGVLFGLITMLIQYVGLFMTGFHTGMLLAVAGLAVYDHTLDRRPPAYWMCLISILCSGIFCAVLNLYWKKAFTVFGTSLYGGAVTSIAFDYFFERMAMVKWLWERAKLEPAVPAPCKLSWIMLMIWPVATIIGIIVQCSLTGNGVYHQQSISAQKRHLKAQQARPITREQRAEMKQRKYRYLYQVRTAHGDVISQSYVQALQKKAQCNNWNGSGGGECSTLQSDSTHLTVLAGSDHHHHDSDDDLNQIRAQH